MKVDVLTSGYVSMDHIIRIATPAKVGFTSLVTNKSNSKIFYGGCSVNIAYALCRLGMKAMPVLRVGGDYESNGFKKFLEEGNVPLDGIDADSRGSNQCMLSCYRIITMTILPYFILEQWMARYAREMKDSLFEDGKAGCDHRCIKTGQ